jgi:hypothetical protein
MGVSILDTPDIGPWRRWNLVPVTEAEILALSNAWKYSVNQSFDLRLLQVLPITTRQS